MEGPSRPSMILQGYVLRISFYNAPSCQTTTTLLSSGSSPARRMNTVMAPPCYVCATLSQLFFGTVRKSGLTVEYSEVVCSIDT